MKWKNKGHEFDHVYDQIQAKSKFYIFGAGDFGKKCFDIFRNEINIIGFIDNDKNKYGKELYGKMVSRLSDIELGQDEGIILTAGQMQRMSMMDELQSLGYRKEEDFFVLEEFLAVYFAYKYNQVYFYNISFLPSTYCNLKCEACLNFNAYTKKFYERKWEDLISDIDLFFHCVDKIILFHVSGGEPMLYPRIADIIEYVDKNYGDRIYQLRTVTNGTVLPPDSVLEKLSRCNVEITVDDYREAVPQYKDKFDKVIAKLEEYKIQYYTSKVDTWVDLAPMDTDYSDWEDKKLQEHFEACCQSWQELRDGKLFSCNYDSYATVAGINDEQKEEVYDLRQYTPEKVKELIEFRLGYNNKGYTNLCKHCRGFSKKNTLIVPCAKQLS